MSIDNKIGLQPELRREMALRDLALGGDIIFSITPATVTPAPTAAAWTRNVVVELTTAAGQVHDWLTDTFATTASIANTSSAGTATIASTTLTIVSGRAVIVVTGSAHDWLNTETDTLTIANIITGGITVTGGTSVETFTT